MLVIILITSSIYNAAKHKSIWKTLLLHYQSTVLQNIMFGLHPAASWFIGSFYMLIHLPVAAQSLCVTWHMVQLHYAVTHSWNICIFVMSCEWSSTLWCHLSIEHLLAMTWWKELWKVSFFVQIHLLAIGISCVHIYVNHLWTGFSTKRCNI